jgi:hypothetical protein
LNFIGIILLYHSTNGSGKDIYTMYLPDGRNDPAQCMTFVPEHYAFIRITNPIDEAKINWPYIPCEQGPDCKLFPLDKDEIKMTGVDLDPDTGVTVKATAGLMPKYVDFNAKANPITPTSALNASVATMKFSTGTLTGIGLGNGMLHTRLTVTTGGGEITINGRNGRSFVVNGGPIDILNLPLQIALGTPGTAMGGNDRVHFFLYHKLVEAGKEPDLPCKAPGDPKQLLPFMHMGLSGPVAGEVSLSIACSNSNYP